MKVSRRALVAGAGTATWGLALPLRRSYAEPEIKEYRLTAKPAVVNLTGDGYPDTADAVEQRARFRRGEQRRLPARHDVPGPAHRAGWIDRHDLAGNKPIEQMADRGEPLLGAQSLHLVEIEEVSPDQRAETAADVSKRSSLPARQQQRDDRRRYRRHEHGKGDSKAGNRASQQVAHRRLIGRALGMGKLRQTGHLSSSSGPSRSVGDDRICLQS
jgi:hypothetical protein